ncbi:hypothetical protein [Caballeronia sp. dw_276]|uniref:hypothetical protein n=1 Tax=Caballeronia sp. dw_276 TaxID=2719795 RepID=UPI001BD3118C|nr:hypothetical protein [Caballeronia sp. dw_276]
MEKDYCGEFFPQDVLDGLVAKIGVTAYAVLAVIAAAATRESPTSTRTLEEISELIDKSVDTTRVAIDVLKKHKLIAVELHGRSNRYRILI